MSLRVNGWHARRDLIASPRPLIAADLLPAAHRQRFGISYSKGRRASQWTGGSRRRSWTAGGGLGLMGSCRRFSPVVGGGSPVPMVCATVPPETNSRLAGGAYFLAYSSSFPLSYQFG